jgi:flavin reductase (DIM6/NTAB) family NADH-FMN oxidoreductase RutF
VTDLQTTTTLAVADMDGGAAYRLFISVVGPRPIAWVSSRAADGSLNLAPFSFFNAVANRPMTVMVSVSARAAGGPKDTLRNVQETGEFVLNLADEALARQMNESSGEWEHGVSEFEKAGLSAVDSVDVSVPRVGEAAIAMECRLTQVVPVGETSYTMILGEVLRFHIRAGLLRENGLIDATKSRPIGRLGGDEYATVGRVFEMKRPVVG